MKARSNFQQTGHPGAQHHASFSGISNSRDDFQQSALACAVATDNSHYISLTDIKSNVLQSPEVFPACSF